MKINPETKLNLFHSDKEATRYLMNQMKPVFRLSASSEVSIVLTGGDSCKPIYSALAREYDDWRNINVILSDERYVEVGDERSNSGLVNTLVSKVVNCPPNILNYAGEARGCVKERTELLNKSNYNDFFPVEFTFLGMGYDGHIASIFPGVDNYESALCLSNESVFYCCKPIPGDIDRISLNLSYLLKTKVVYLLTSELSRLEVIKRSLSFRSTRLPIDHLIQQDRVPVKIIWYP